MQKSEALVLSKITDAEVQEFGKEVKRSVQEERATKLENELEQEDAKSISKPARKYVKCDKCGPYPSDFIRDSKGTLQIDQCKKQSHKIEMIDLAKVDSKTHAAWVKSADENAKQEEAAKPVKLSDVSIYIKISNHIDDLLDDPGAWFSAKDRLKDAKKDNPNETLETKLKHVILDDISEVFGNAINCTEIVDSKLEKLDFEKKAAWVKTAEKRGLIGRKGKPAIQDKEPNAALIVKAINDIDNLISENMMAKLPEPDHAQIGDTIMRTLKFAKLENEQWDQLMISENRTYVRRGYTVIKQILTESMASKKSSFKAEVTRYIGDKVPKKVEDFDADHNILNFKNCFYNWETGEISTDPEYYDSMVQIDTEYRQDAGELQEFLDFMQSVMPIEKRRNGLLEGTALVFLRTLVHEETAVFLVGDGSNGKSTYLHIIQKILGDNATASIPIHKLEKRFQAAEVNGKFAVIYNEIPKEPLESNEMYNNITTRDRIQGERKGQDPFYFNPFCILLFGGNNLPEKPSYKLADVRRDIIFEFTRTFRDEEKDSSLWDYFITEENKTKILNTLMKYAKNVLDQGGLSFKQSDDEKDLLYKFRSSAALSFVTQRLRKRHDGKGDNTDQMVFQEFGKWCVDNGRDPEELNVLKNVCKKCGYIKSEKPTKRNGVSGRYWANMIIRQDKENGAIDEAYEDDEDDTDGKDTTNTTQKLQ